MRVATPCRGRWKHWPAVKAILLCGLAAAAARGQDRRELVVPQLETSRELYTTAALWDVRRAALREGFLEGAGLWPLPKRTPLNPIVHSRRAYDGYTVENVALETFPGFWCTGNLYRPAEPEQLQASVLCPHGHFRPLGRFREEHQVRCAHLARMGATVFSYGMVGWQDSTQTTHDDPLVLALQTWNSIRAIDYVLGLDGVDPERVAVTGASGGGTQALYASLVDDRVKVSAPVVIVYPWAAPDGCLCEGGLPVMQAVQTNAIELAAAAAPRPQLLISAGDDPTHDFPQVGFPFVEHVYKLYGRGDDVANVHLAREGHDYGPSKRRAMYEFFARHLQLGLIEEDLGKITIEPPELLSVFDEQHPLPPHALHGRDAIARALRELPRTKLTEKDPRTAWIEASLFIPPGFDKAGQPRFEAGREGGRLDVVVRDGRTGQPTCCRLNVVGPDGQFYQPPPNDLTPYALTAQWPRAGRGNREGKAPIRYYGRFFYSRGESRVEVPAGQVRIEAWKGLEYRPQTAKVEVSPGEASTVTIELSPTVVMSEAGYYSGDFHLHLPRASDADDQRILDLLEAEGVRYGALLAFNEPAGPYAGTMERMATPQHRGLGAGSVCRRGEYQIVSGQEYRSSTYGHLNLYQRDDLVLPLSRVEADDWPLYGELGRQTQLLGGFAFYAHGGYAQAIYADLVQGNVNGVELLQFGVYRGIGLEDWYHILNAGFRFPCVGASDYPACRKLADCLSYVHHETPPTFDEWFRAAAEGRSFATTGPLLLLEVDGCKPGGIVRREGPGPHEVQARVRVLSEVAPITQVQLIAGGKVVRELKVDAREGRGRWLEFEQPLELSASSWIAARAFSKSPTGEPDAEAHTNPVYVYLDGKAPYDQASLDVLVQRVESQLAAHERREFAEKEVVVAYFRKSRERLLEIRAAGGLADSQVPGLLSQAGARRFDPSARAHTEEELREFLRPVPPKPPAEAQGTFDVQDGFRMELVAAEPLLHDPVAAAFDENGRLFVAELTDYPYLPDEGQKPLGAIRLLEDLDGDGVFDRSSVFADELLWPTGIVPWKGGIFAAAAPDIWYFQDTDGDGRAELRQRVFTGFGTQNPQGMLNNLVLGLDHKVYGATSSNGGTIRPADNPAAEGVSVDGKDFLFDPVTLELETISGTVQFGNTFDDWGRRFVCSESQPLMHVALPQHYLARNPYLPVPSAIHNLAPAPVPIFRISPLERWRVIRSARRIAHGERPADMPGASHHVVDAAAGVTIYRGGAYPGQYYGNVFVGDAQNNLVHRRLLEPEGATFTSRRADDQREFVRSPDNWFRPVNFVNAPDGTLYVLDLSREVLEAIHIPLDVVKFLDLTHGRGYGRIYRLAPAGFVYPGPPRLGDASGEELVAALESPHGWWRDTAHRLIYERQDQSLAESLRRLVRGSASPQARLHALWSLDGLGALGDEDLLAGLRDQAAGVRENAVRLAESRLEESAELRRQVIAMAGDPEPRVRFQAAFTLGEIESPEAIAALVDMARREAGDSWMRTAVLSSLAASAHTALAELASDRNFAESPAGASFLEQLAMVIGARRRADEVNETLDAVAACAPPGGSLEQRLLLSLGGGLKRAGGRLDAAAEAGSPGERLIRRLLNEALQKAADRDAPETERGVAARMLACYPFGQTRTVLASLLDPAEPQSVRLSAVRALADQSEDEVADVLLERWNQLAPAVAEAVLEALLARETWSLEYLRAVERGGASLAQLDSAQRGRLLDHRNAAVRDLAGRLFAGVQPADRKQVIADYQAALASPGDRQRGLAVFQKHCQSCHKIGESGFGGGPDLTNSPGREPAALLSHILDPNSNVAPNYVQYVVIDRQGRTYAGLITSETATSVTLRSAKEVEETILRSQIEEIASTGKSFMPEGFEHEISPPEMADLLAYLQSLQAPAPLDVGTEGAMVEPQTRAGGR